MIFKELKYNSFFEKNGYVVLDFYKPEEIDKLYSDFLRHNLDVELQESSNDDIYINSSESLNVLLSAFFNPLINKIFTNRIYLFGEVLFKYPGPNSTKSPHQDWSIVDESKYHGIGLLSPFLDINKNNGIIGVIPGSHNYFFNRRGSGTKSEYEEVSNYLEKNLFKYLPLKKGQVLIFDNRLIHYSRSNRSDKVRIVAGCATADSDAEIIHYMGKEDGLIVQLRAIDSSFFINKDFSKISFEEDGDFKLFEQSMLKQISHKELFQYVSKYDTRLLYRIKYYIKSKLMK